MKIQERTATLQDESGYRMQLDEIILDQIELKWGNYVNPQEKVLSFHPERSAVVSHFKMGEPQKVKNARKSDQPDKQFVIYRESGKAYDFYVEPTTGHARTFFELNISDNFFNNLLTDESGFMMSFQNYSAGNAPSSGFTAQMTPAMYGIIGAMRHAPYVGHLKGLYLETKTIELFLMQVGQLDAKNVVGYSKLKSRDIEALYHIKHFIDEHYSQPCSIAGLAKHGGINQTRLKSGFKELFNTTVFTYVSDVRMLEAKRLLLDEQLYVNEVADIVGYKHPHHFTAAFKKKFNIVPKDLKTK